MLDGKDEKMSRREAARLMARSAVGLLLTRAALGAQEMDQQTTGKLALLQRAIPSSSRRFELSSRAA